MKGEFIAVKSFVPGITVIANHVLLLHFLMCCLTAQSIKSIGPKRGKNKVKLKNNNLIIDLKNDNEFGCILICAIRYSLGRQTYMPKLVMDFIRPIIHKLDDRTLIVAKSDIKKARRDGLLGDPNIDAPEWERFLFEINQELLRRDDK